MTHNEIILIVKNMNFVDSLYSFMKDHEIKFSLEIRPDYFQRSHLRVTEAEGKRLIEMFGRDVIDDVRNLDS